MLLAVLHICGHTIIHKDIIWFDEYDRNKILVELERKKCPKCHLENLRGKL